MIRTLFAALAFALAAPASAQPMKPGPGMQKPAPGGQDFKKGPPPQVRMPWVDVHLHLIGKTPREQDYPGAITAALAEMDRFGIATAIVLPPPQVDSQVRSDYEEFAESLKRHPGRFAFLGGGGVLNPILHRHADPAKVSEAAKREFVAAAERIAAAGAAGFGEMASLHISAAAGHPYEFVPADHPLLLALADVAAKHGMPIDLHMDAVAGEAAPPTWLLPGAANPAKLPDTMAALPRLLAHNPQARIVWAHGGADPVGAMTAGAIRRLMDAHANLYVSLRIAGLQAPMKNKVFGAPESLDADWRELLARHADRFVIGSDAFVASPNLRGSGPGMQFAENNERRLRATLAFLSLLPEDAARKIARDNAVRIYRLPAR